MIDLWSAAFLISTTLYLVDGAPSASEAPAKATADPKAPESDPETTGKAPTETATDSDPNPNAPAKADMEVDADLVVEEDLPILPVPARTRGRKAPSLAAQNPMLKKKGTKK